MSSVKKLLALILSLAMVFSLFVPVFGAEESGLVELVASFDPEFLTAPIEEEEEVTLTLTSKDGSPFTLRGYTFNVIVPEGVEIVSGVIHTVTTSATGRETRGTSSITVTPQEDLVTYNTGGTGVGKTEYIEYSIIFTDAVKGGKQVFDVQKLVLNDGNEDKAANSTMTITYDIVDPATIIKGVAVDGTVTYGDENGPTLTLYNGKDEEFGENGPVEDTDYVVTYYDSAGVVVEDITAANAGTGYKVKVTNAEPASLVYTVNDDVEATFVIEKAERALSTENGTADNAVNVAKGGTIDVSAYFTDTADDTGFTEAEQDKGLTYTASNGWTLDGTKLTAPTEADQSGSVTVTANATTNYEPAADKGRVTIFFKTTNGDPLEAKFEDIETVYGTVVDFPTPDVTIKVDEEDVTISPDDSGYAKWTYALKGETEALEAFPEDAGEYDIIVNGSLTYNEKPYEGSFSFKYTVNPFDLSNDDVTVTFTPKEDEELFYSGDLKKPEYVIVFDGTPYDETLVSNEDYVVGYSNNISAGKAYISVNGIGNYTGAVSESFTINPLPLTSDNSELIIPDGGYEYDGTTKTPGLRLTIGAGDVLTGIVLERNKDYAVISYENNINASIVGEDGKVTTPAVATFTKAEGEDIVTNYDATGLVLTFPIAKRSFSNVSASFATPVVYKPGDTYEPTVIDTNLPASVTKDTLEKGSQYTLTWANDTAPVGKGSYKWTIAPTDTGNYEGAAKTGTLVITAAERELSAQSTTASMTVGTPATLSSLFTITDNAASEAAADGYAYKIAIANSSMISVEGSKLDAVLTPNSAGVTTITLTAPATDNYGSASLRFTVAINEQGVTSRSISFQQPSLSIEYGAEAVENPATVSAGGGTVSYSSSDTKVATVSSAGLVKPVGAGEATITATVPVTTAEGLTYAACVATSTVTVTPVSLERAVVTVPQTEVTYNGKAFTPKPTVKFPAAEDGSTKEITVPAANYTVSYKDNINAGTATVTVVGQGNYTREATTTFTIKKADRGTLTLTPNVKYIDAPTQFTVSGASDLDNSLKKSLSFESRNTNAATVDDNGLVTVVANGKTTITATVAESANYKDATATIEDLVVVKDYVTVGSNPVEVEGNGYTDVNGNVVLPTAVVIPGLKTLFVTGMGYVDDTVTVTYNTFTTEGIATTAASQSIGPLKLISTSNAKTVELKLGTVNYTVQFNITAVPANVKLAAADAKTVEVAEDLVLTKVQADAIAAVTSKADDEIANAMAGQIVEVMNAAVIAAAAEAEKSENSWMKKDSPEDEEKFDIVVETGVSGTVTDYDPSAEKTDTDNAGGDADTTGMAKLSLNAGPFTSTKAVEKNAVDPDNPRSVDLDTSSAEKDIHKLDKPVSWTQMLPDGYYNGKGSMFYRHWFDPELGANNRPATATKQANHNGRTFYYEDTYVNPVKNGDNYFITMTAQYWSDFDILLDSTEVKLTIALPDGVANNAGFVNGTPLTKLSLGDGTKENPAVVLFENDQYQFLGWKYEDGEDVVYNDGGIIISGEGFDAQVLTVELLNVLNNHKNADDDTLTIIPNVVKVYPVTVNFANATLKYNDGEEQTTSPVTVKAQAGRTVKLTLTPKKNYKFSEWTVDSGTPEEISDRTATELTFKMPLEPLGPVVLTATLEETSSPSPGDDTGSGGGGSISAGGGGGGGGGGASSSRVNVAAASNGTVKVDKPNADTGDTVTITVTPNSGYRTDKVTVTDAKGGVIEVTDKGNGTYTFKMPTANNLIPVKVNATFVADDGSTPTGFSDVPANEWFADAVKWAIDNNITQGKGNNLFAPNDTCTRAEAVTFLYRAAGSPDVTYSGDFSDVTSGDWFANAVAWAVANGITQGKGEGMFDPYANCSRAEIVTFLARFAKAGETEPSTQFTDVAATDYFAGAVAWAVENGITQGKGTSDTFAPADDCNRAEIVTFLYRYFVK